MALKPAKASLVSSSIVMALAFRIGCMYMVPAFWLDDPIFKPGYNFNPNSEFAYKIPETTEHNKFLEHINGLPDKDSPAIFGLNNLADLTFRLNESTALITTLVDVQPKDSGSGGGLSREDQVKKEIEDKILKELPANFDPIDTAASIERFRSPKGLDPKKNVPLSIFLKQEISQLQKILDIVRTML